LLNLGDRFNSVIYASLSANNYIVLGVNPAFTQPGYLDASLVVSQSRLDAYNNESQDAQDTITGLHEAAITGNLQRLDKVDCIRTYATPYLSDYSNLLLVTSNTSSGTPQVISIYFNDNDGIDKENGCTADAFSWICPASSCSAPCQSMLGQVEQSPSLWNPFNLDVDYCLGQRTDEKCKLHFSIILAVVILVFNAVQGVLMLVLAYRMRDDDPLLTIGDAITSFLSEPDSSTIGCCLHSALDFQTSGPAWSPRAVQWKEQQYTYAQSCSLVRRYFSYAS